MDERNRTVESGADDHDVARLVKLGGQRVAPLDRRLERIRGAAHAEWARVVAQRRRRTVTAVVAIGLAAALLLAVRLVQEPDRDAPGAPPLTATLTSATGAVERTGRQDQPTMLRIGDAVTARDQIQTPGAVVAAFTLASGAVLRVNERTRVHIESPSGVRVERGTVYLDTEGVSSDGAIEVRTPLGVIRDIGTQFEVDVTALRTRVRVREGEVVLTRSTSETRARRGTQIVAEADGVATSAVPVFGADWEWIGRVPSAFDLSAHTLMEFLTWVSRETGYSVAFENEDLATRVTDMTVQGSVDGLTPEEALEAVLPATGLEYSLRDGRVTVRTQ